MKATELEDIIRDLRAAKALLAGLSEQYNSKALLPEEDNALAHNAIESMLHNVLDRLKALADSN